MEAPRRGASLGHALEVALEHADVDQRRIGRVRPQVLAAEAHVVGGLVRRPRRRAHARRGRDTAATRSPRRRSCRGCSRACGRVPARSRPHAHAIARAGSARVTRRCVRPGALGAASGKAPRARRSSSSRVTMPFSTQQRREARERALVVARREVVARLHALDRVAVLVHVEDAEPHREARRANSRALPTARGTPSRCSV